MRCRIADMLHTYYSNFMGRRRQENNATMCEMINVPLALFVFQASLNPNQFIN